MTFEEAIAALGATRVRGWRLGLDRMQEFLRRLELEDSLGAEGGPQYLHVAGTNGKGSVTAYLQSLLLEQGYRTGATFSPYVYDVRERVMLDRELIPKEDFARLVERLIAVADTMTDKVMGSPTEFELKTALGFAYWAEQRCDAVALEVGLGGRLDATNVVTPRVSAIVSIGFDHMEYLGDTLAKIATEKAGIIKPGRPVVIGAMADEARAAILEVAAEQESEAWSFGQEIRLSPEGDGWRVATPAGEFGGWQTPLKGVIQPANAALAIGALAASGLLRDPERIPGGIAKTRVPGRFEERLVDGQRWVLDGAHNGPAAQSLAASLRSEGYEGATLIFGMMRGHDPARVADPLAAVVCRVIVVPIDNSRAQSAEDVAQAWRDLGRPVTVVGSAREAVDMAKTAGDQVVVTGSFYLLTDVDAALRCESSSRPPRL